jgi:hypothetical protein
MRWRDSKMRDSVRETIGRVRAELSEKKRRASRSPSVQAHGRNEFKKLFAMRNSSLYERFMETTIMRRVGHRGPNPGALTIVYTLLFNFGLYFVVSFRMPEHPAPSTTALRPYFPGPWESAQTIVTYFQTHPHAVLMCAFLQFGAAIPLGIFTATIVSRLRYLGVRAAGADIALFGGIMTAINIAISALVLWVMAYPGIADEPSVVRALYYMVFAIGGVGFSVPMGLLLAGITIPALMMKLLAKWLIVSGLIIAVIGELSFFSLVVPGAVFLIPLTRFPSFLWLIAVGFMLPKRLEEIDTSKRVS